MVLLPPIISISRPDFSLTFWSFSVLVRKFVPKRVYKIAVGQQGHETPTGMYFVEWKTRTPDWLAPNADWVLPPERRGKVFPFDSPDNPFDGGFMSVDQADGIGIHGTKFPPRLGENVSHGCIRMDTNQFLQLYSRTPIGTPVFIY